MVVQVTLVRITKLLVSSKNYFLGHYTSTVYDAKCNTWWIYDDTSVTSCTEERVLKNLAPDAYGVMYIHKYIFRIELNNYLYNFLLFILEIY